MPWTVPARVKFDQLRVLFGGRCVDCGVERGRDPKHPKLEFSHVKPTPVVGKGRGSWHRYNDIVSHPDAYVLRCYECHRKADRPTVAVYCPEAAEWIQPSNACRVHGPNPQTHC